MTLKTLLGLGRSGTSSNSAATAEVTTTSGMASGSLECDPSTDFEVNLGVARYARKELPVRLARLIKATQKLPFIVGTNPYIKRVYKLYYDSFQTITASTEEIEDKESLDRFAALLQGLVESHADVVPMLSQGKKLKGRKFDQHKGGTENQVQEKNADFLTLKNSVIMPCDNRISRM